MPNGNRVRLVEHAEGALADSAARKRFHTEAQALSKLSHPHIALVFDFDTQQGVDFWAMENDSRRHVGLISLGGVLSFCKPLNFVCSPHRRTFCQQSRAVFQDQVHASILRFFFHAWP